MRGPWRIACHKPPTGWKCSRPPGHDGPCAASPHWWNLIINWITGRFPT